MINKETNYIPYETLARAQADDIVREGRDNILSNFTLEQRVVVEELLADAYGRGLDDGFSLSDFNGDSPADLMNAYNAGIEAGKKERG